MTMTHNDAHALETAHAISDALEETPAPVRLTDLASVEEEEPRKLPGRRARIEMVTGETFEVRITNRDYVRWDLVSQRAKFPAAKDAPFLFATYLAWSAATRDGLTSLKWEMFRDSVEDLENLEEDPSDALGPTQ